MNVLVIGSGGREHALVLKIKQSKRVDKIYCAPGNAGIADHAQIVDLNVNDFDKLVDFAKKSEIDLTVVGHEDPLANGIVDEFQKHGLKIFGPDKKGAMLEASKAFAKEIMMMNNVPTAYAAEFTDSKNAINYLKSKQPPYVIKAYGLCAGKGVVVTSDLKEAQESVKKMLDDKSFGAAGAKILIEDYLDGEEASILAFTDGETIKTLLPSQDHKRVYENDEGPNTGGMGAYAPASLITDELLEQIYDEILYPVLNGLKNKGINYKGVLYAGLMITDTGPKVVEFNVRFGDPETQAVLPLLKSDIVDLMLACIDGDLKNTPLENKNLFSCCVIAASGGYPLKYEKGKEITGLDNEYPDSIIYHSGTKKQGDRIVTNGGRVLGVTSLACDLNTAQQMSLDVLKKIIFDKMHFRSDIGTSELNRKKISVIMGSDSDLEVMRVCLDILSELEISFDVTIGSAHRTPERVKLFAKNLKRKGVKTVICAAGLSAHLAGVVASLTPLPVIGVPMSGGSLGGLDALLSTVNMPGGIPVATVSLGKAGAKNAAILAAKIIALSDKDVEKRLTSYLKNMNSKVIEKNAKLQDVGYENY